jgi:hypothetical protein
MQYLFFPNQKFYVKIKYFIFKGKICYSRPRLLLEWKYYVNVIKTHSVIGRWFRIRTKLIDVGKEYSYHLEVNFHHDISLHNWNNISSHLLSGMCQGPFQISYFQSCITFYNESKMLCYYFIVHVREMRHG